MNQFIHSAVAEKMTALLTEKYLSQRVKLRNKKAFLEALGKVPDSTPSDEDKL